MQESTSLPEATHASHSALQESEKDRMTNATCGQKCSALCEKSSPVGLLEKMLLGTLPLDSTMFVMTWKAKTTKRGRLFFRLSPLGRSMEGRGSLWWPTPKASDAIMGMTARTSGRPIERSTHLQTIVGLSVGWKPGDGHLNPTWVEWLMGFPIGWTEIEDSETQ